PMKPNPYEGSASWGGGGGATASKGGGSASAGATLPSQFNVSASPGGSYSLNVGATTGGAGSSFIGWEIPAPGLARPPYPGGALIQPGRPTLIIGPPGGAVPGWNSNHLNQYAAFRDAITWEAGMTAPIQGFTTPGSQHWHFHHGPSGLNANLWRK